MKMNLASRHVRRLIAKAMPAVLGTTLVATGAVAPVAHTGSKPTVEAREQLLSERAATPGFAKAVDTGLPADAVGFQWNGNKNGAVEVRSLLDGRWSEWLLVEGNPVEGPDVRSKEHRNRTGAGPVWVGRGVQKVEVRVAEGSLDGLKLHAIRSEEPSGSGGLGIKPAGSAVAQPGIITRSQWGADESWRRFASGCNGQPEYAPSVRLAVVHHTASSNNYGPGDTAAILRSIYHFHTHTNGWCDLGYNFLVDRYGQIFEGRAGGIHFPVVGAHAQNHNYQSTGVSLIGTFNNDAVPGAMYNALKAVLAWKLHWHTISPTAVLNYNGRLIPTIVGHRDLNSTDCPGSKAHALIPQIRNELAGVVNAPPAVALVSANSAKVADVSAGSQTPAATVLQWRWAGGLNQQWRMVPIGDRLYKIVNINSGMVLDVSGASKANGARIIQYPWIGGANQMWFGLPFGDPNVLVFISASSGKVLDVNGASKADGAPLIQWPWNGGANQVWIRIVVG